MDPALILFGLGVGILVGMTGMGGGSLMTPLLILVFGIKPVVAVGTDLAYAAVTKTVGGWQHFRKGTVFPRMALWLAVGSCPGALAGVWLLDILRDTWGDGFDTFMLIAIGSALLLTGSVVLMRALSTVNYEARERRAFRMETRHKVAAVALGGSVGFVLGITSAGSGTLIAIGLIIGFRLSPHRVVGTDVAHAAVLLLVAAIALGGSVGFVLGITSAGSGTLIAIGLIIGFRLSPHRVVGTDVAHAAVLLWVAAIAHMFSGNIDYGLAGTILLGSVPGVWIGTHLSTLLPQTWLRVALGTVMVASSLALIGKAGLDIPVAVLVGAPIAIVAVSAGVLRRRAHQRPRQLEVAS